MIQADYIASSKTDDDIFWSTHAEYGFLCGADRCAHHVLSPWRDEKTANSAAAQGQLARYIALDQRLKPPF